MSRSLDALILQNIYSLRELQRLSGAARTTIIRHRRKLRKLYPDNPELLLFPEAAPEPNTQLLLPDVSPSTSGMLHAPAGGESISLPPVPSSSRACEPYREKIVEFLNAGYNATAIWQELVERYSVPFGYQSVKRYVAKLRPVREVFNRIETPPGFEAQADYGEGAPTFDPATGKFRKPRLFVIVLSYSRWHFAQVVWKSSQKVWSELHEAAFTYFGGAPKTLKIDNLKEGVTKIDPYEPQLNALYASCMAHYNVTAIPCRPFSPNQKEFVGYCTMTGMCKKPPFLGILARPQNFVIWPGR